MSPLYYSRLAESGLQHQTMALERSRRGMVLNSIRESRGHSFGGTLPRGRPSSAFVGGRWPVDDAHWARNRSSTWTPVGVIGEEEKYTEYDPATVPPQGYQRQRIASDAQDRGPTADRRHPLGKLGRSCRERAYKAFFTWRDRIVGGGGEGPIGGGNGSGSGSEPKPRPAPEPAPEPECDPGDGAGRFYRVPAPRAGATASRLLAKSTRTDMSETPEMTRRRLSLPAWVRPRPTSTSAWLAGPVSTSTMQRKRASVFGHLVKRRHESVQVAPGERDQVTTRHCA